MLAFPELVKFNCNMLYTGKGDGGTTKTLLGNERIPKNHNIIEALGSLDELNAWLGYCRNQAKKNNLLEEKNISQKILNVQENLFTIQGIVAGADLNFLKEKTTDIEIEIKNIEDCLEPINSFLISGESECGALFDFARTIARRAERRVISARQGTKITDEIISYLNRLSSFLYALARLASKLEERQEKAPSYK